MASIFLHRRLNTIKEGLEALRHFEARQPANSSGILRKRVGSQQTAPTISSIQLPKKKRVRRNSLLLPVSLPSGCACLRSSSGRGRKNEPPPPEHSLEQFRLSKHERFLHVVDQRIGL